MSKFQGYRTFAAIVECGSLSQAAAVLHKSTSTVSKQLAKLEEELGATLVERTTQSIAVTPLGEEFYFQCKQILRSVEEAERAVRDRLVTPSGKLSISVPEVLLHTDLLRYLGDYSRLYPLVKLNLSVSNQAEDLIEHRHDFAFRIESLNDERLVAVPLMEVRLVVVTSPAFLAQEGEPRNLADVVARNQLILPSYVNIPRVSRLLGPVVGDQPADIQSCHSATSEAAILEMVHAGMGVALLLDASVKRFLENGTFVQLFEGEELLSRTVYLVSRAVTHTSRLQSMFRNYIRGRYQAGREATGDRIEEFSIGARAGGQ